METEISFYIHSLELAQHRLYSEVFREVDNLLHRLEKKEISLDDVVKKLRAFQEYFKVSRFVSYTDSEIVNDGPTDR